MGRIWEGLILFLWVFDIKYQGSHLVFDIFVVVGRLFLDISMSLQLACTFRLFSISISLIEMSSHFLDLYAYFHSKIGKNVYTLFWIRFLCNFCLYLPSETPILCRLEHSLLSISLLSYLYCFSFFFLFPDQIIFNDLSHSFLVFLLVLILVCCWKLRLYF